MQVVVPDLGDFSDVEVVEVLVDVGATVGVEDPLIVLETDKATMEVPATDSGVKSDLAHKNKKGNNSQAVGRKYVPDISDQQAQSGIKVDHMTKPDKTQEAHGKTHRHFGVQKNH